LRFRLLTHIYQYICLSIRLSIDLHIHLSIYLHLYPYIHLSILPSRGLPVYLSICLSKCMHTCRCNGNSPASSRPIARVGGSAPVIAFRKYVRMTRSDAKKINSVQFHIAYAHLSNYLSIYISIQLSIYRFIQMSICLSIYLSIYLSMNQFI